MSNSERLVIVGGGGFGREIICWAEDCHAAGTLPPVGGFIDDQVTELPPAYGVPHLGTFTDYTPRDGDQFIVAVGRPATKRAMVESLKARGARFATLVHPKAIVVRTATLGEGVILCPHTMVSPDARVERFVTIINFSGMGHDSVIGEFTTLSSIVDVTGNVTVGADVFIGAGARLLPGIKVGDGALIGAGATVMRSVKPGTTVYTQPAKTLKMPVKEG